jgi:hypothetical protein
MLDGYSGYSLLSLPTYLSEQYNLNYRVEIDYDISMQTDFKDIRFTDSDGDTELYQFREKYSLGVSATYWIKVPVCPMAGKTIYMFVGNALATLKSSLADTLITGDEFIGNDGDNLNHGIWTVSNDLYFKIYSNMCRFTHGSGGTGARCINSIIPIGTHFGVRMSIMDERTYASQPLRRCGAAPASTPGTPQVSYYHGGNYRRWQSPTSYADTLVTIYNNWSLIDVKCTAAGKTYKYYNSDVLDDTIANVYAINDQYIHLSSWTLGGPSQYYLWLAYIFAYKLPDDESENDELEPGPITPIGPGGKTWRSHKFAYENYLSSWKNAVKPGENDEIAITGLGPLIDKTEINRDPCAGFAWIQNLYKGRIIAQPEISLPLRFSGREWSFVAQLMGIDSVSGGGPYQHDIDLVDVIDGADLFGTLTAILGLETTQLLFEWPTVKIKKFKIESDGSGRMNLVVSTVANRINLGSDCLMTAADFDDVSHIFLDSLMPRIIPFSGARFRINDFSDAALDSGDIIKISKLSIEFDRDLSQEFDANESTDGWESSEPIENQIPNIAMTIEIPQMELTRLQEYQTQSTKKCDILFSHDATYSILFEFPCIQIIDPDAPVNGPARIKQSIKFASLEALSAPDGMSRTKFGITLIDDYSGVYS